jgi:hypothetical protein
MTSSKQQELFLKLHKSISSAASNIRRQGHLKDKQQRQLFIEQAYSEILDSQVILDEIVFEFRRTETCVMDVPYFSLAHRQHN